METCKANHILDRGSHRMCSVGKDVPRNFAKFTGKHLRQGKHLSRTPSEVVFEEFHYKCRTTILKNASMAASGDNFIFEIFLNGGFSKTAAKIYLF